MAAGSIGSETGRGNVNSQACLNWLAFILGVAADGRARRFIIDRESPGVIVMVFCS